MLRLTCTIPSSPNLVSRSPSRPIHLILNTDHHITLGFVEGNIVLDLLHALEGLRVVPGQVWDLCFVDGDGVVACVTFVGAVRGRGCGCEVGLCDGGGRELWGCLLVMVRRQGMDSENGEVGIEEWWWNCVWVRHARRCFRPRLPRWRSGRLPRRLLLRLRGACLELFTIDGGYGRELLDELPERMLLVRLFVSSIQVIAE